MTKAEKPSVPIEVIESKLKELGMTLKDWGFDHLKPSGLDIGFNVILEEGTILLAPYRDDVYKARIVAGGVMIVDGEGLKAKDKKTLFPNLRLAANFISDPFKGPKKGTTNAWDFWKYVRTPGSPRLFELKNLRNPEDRESDEE